MIGISLNRLSIIWIRLQMVDLVSTRGNCQGVVDRKMLYSSLDKYSQDINDLVDLPAEEKDKRLKSLADIILKESAIV